MTTPLVPALNFSQDTLTQVAQTVLALAQRKGATAVEAEVSEGVGQGVTVRLGEVETIEYNGRTDNVRFITRAELRRYRGGALSDQITGAVIVYNNLTDVFTVDGQKKATPSADGQTGSGRVRAVLAPKEPAAGAAAPVAPASGPALRPSNSLGGGSQ